MKTKTSKQAKTQPAQHKSVSHPVIGVLGYISEKMADLSQQVVKSIRGKKAVALVVVMTGMGISAAQAQTTGSYLVGESKKEVVIKTATGQYGDPNAQSKTAKEDKNAQQVAVINSPVAHNIIGEDKYLKTKEADKKYTQFQVFDIKGMDKDQVVLGMLTNTLDRGTRYNQVGNEQKVAVTSTSVTRIDVRGQEVKGEKVPVSTFRFKDKVFVIIGDDDYRYMDGVKLVGDEKLVNELMKGKPITEVTFFYELQKAGIVNPYMTPTKFAQLSITEKQRLLNKGIMAGNL